MNWYRKASSEELWEEIKRFGPHSDIDLDDPKEMERLKVMADMMGISLEEMIEKASEKGSWNPLAKRHFNPYLDEFSKRKYFTENYGWSVPSQEAIEEITEFVGDDNVLEIASGYGLWAKLLQNSGISVTPTDFSLAEYRDVHVPHAKRFTNVEDLEAMEAIQKYGMHKVLMMSWPAYDSPMAAKALKGFQGNKLIFVGEGYGGCTADDDFFELLNKYWTEVKRINIPQWEGIHDDLSLWVKK